jgi:hypothetical protein
VKRPTIERRTSYADAFGRSPGEKLSEFFDFERWPEKAEKKVTRHELSVILSQYHRAIRYGAWYMRLWRWLLAKRGSGPVAAVPTTDMTAKDAKDAPTPKVTP